ncbi:MAG: sugar phosphate isomerase/epimerase [Verrucomicrobiales bacterium]|jgi:sugar phosphate isomerase/epimerase
MNSISRRQFFAGSSAALLSVGVSSSQADSETCGLGIGTYGLQSLPLGDSIGLVAKTGFNAIDLFVAPGYNCDPQKLSREQKTDLRSRLADSGLRLIALIADLRPSSEKAQQDAKTEEVKRILDFGTELNSDSPPPVQATLGGKDWKQSKNLFAEALGKWSELAADAKTIFAAKPHRGSAMSTPAQAAELFRQLGEPKSLRMVYDYSHYAFRDMPIADTVETALPWTSLVAVKDTILVDGKTRFALPGEGGTWDNAEIIQRFHAGGFRGDFSCEVSAQIWKGDPNYEPIAATRKCFENMVAAFERAGVERA